MSFTFPGLVVASQLVSVPARKSVSEVSTRQVSAGGGGGGASPAISASSAAGRGSGSCTSPTLASAAASSLSSRGALAVFMPLDGHAYGTRWPRLWHSMAAGVGGELHAREDRQLDEARRVDHAARHVNAQMEMRAGRTAGMTGEADLAALRDLV